MNFASFAFAVFLPTVWTVYWLLSIAGVRHSRRWQNGLLLGASYLFYGWWDYRFCALMLLSSLVDYIVAARIHLSEDGRTRKRWLYVSLLCNLGCLGFFKYFGFFAESLQSMASQFGTELRVSTLNIILPVGISFYTFQTLSYTIDVYRRKLKPTAHLLDYLAFVSFFPQLVAGPIERATRLVPQFERERHFHYDYVREGLRRILWGLFKKVVMADTLAPLVVTAYADPATQTSGSLLIGTLCFAFQIYCDFSAYSDIALGSSQLFGIKLMRNFAYPYFSQNLREFWQRWHISLSTWFRDYVYIPLGGNRVSRPRQVLNLLATFVVSGLWHGAAMRFVVWGALHGFAVAASRPVSRKDRFARRKPGGAGWLPTPLAALRILSTFSIVCLGWVFFRADSIADACLIVQRLSEGVLDGSIFAQVTHLASTDSKIAHGLKWIGAFVLIEWVGRKKEYPLQIDRWPEPFRWSAYAAFMWLVLEYGRIESNNPFIYFQF